MSNSKSHMDREEAEDHSKIFEQQIFTRGVLGYCTHFEIPSNNRYNINFVHFQDFEALYYQEKLTQQNSKLILAEEKTDFDSPKKIAKAIENILVAKNNYQRIMLQMLDTIYHQEQQLKHHTLLLDLQNAVTSRTDTYTNKLKDTITYLTANQALAQTPPSSVPVHSSLYTSDAQNTKHLTDKLGNRDTAKTPRNTSERKKAPASQPNTLNNLKKSSHGQRNNFSIDLASMPKQTSKKSSTSCFSQRLSNNKTTYQTPRTKGISTSQQNSMCKGSGSLVDDGSKVVKKLSYFTRRVSDVCSSARLYEKQDSKTNNRESKNNGKVQKKDKENIGKGDRRYRNMSCNLSRRQSEENDLMSSMSKDFIPTEVSEDDNKGKKLVSISSIQEDCNDHEYESFKINRTKTVPNNNNKDEIIVVEDLSSKYIKEGAYRAPWIQNDKAIGKIASEHQVSANNKSISFQSSSENHFHETENARMTIPDELVLREVCNNKGKCEWPKEIFCTDGDQKYLEKPWDFLENNLVTSPSFGAQTMGIENRLSQNLGITERRKSKGKVERKDNEILGKLYGGTSLLKKKQWAPLFSTKKC